MQLDGRQLQIRRDVGVLDLPGVLDRLAAQHLRDERRRRDRGAAPERLELGIADRAVVFHLEETNCVSSADEHFSLGFSCAVQ